LAEIKKRSGVRDLRKSARKKPAPPIDRKSGVVKRTQAKPEGASAAAQRKKGKAAAKEIDKNVLKVIPLGGLHEIGKNMTLLEYENSIIIIDCGMSFPEDEMFGIDIVIPDFSYLEDNAHKVKGMILTHGHEDHIGSIPYLLKKMHLPIYGTRLTLGLVESKLSEHGLKADFHSINAGDKFRIGPFAIEAIRVTHSIADSVCFCIDTPVGRVFHTGDY